MGGLGLAQTDANKVGGAQIVAEGGHVVLDGCSVTDDGGEGKDWEPQLENPAEWWIFAVQSLALRNSSFRSTTPGQGLLRLQASQLELLIRGCELENVAIGIAADASVRPIGIVDSTFEPALDQSVPTIRPPSGKASCGVELARERLCDPRAACEGVTKGGVRCSCVGAGLRYKPGVHEDGRQCEQDTSLRAVLESESVAVAVAKPGVLANRTLTLIVEARGEAELAVSFNVTMTRKEAGSGTTVAANHSIRIDEPLVSAFGLHVEWKQLPPAPTWRADLDGSQLKFADTSRHEFTMRLACDDSELSCAADGDVITTVVQLASAQDSRLQSLVTVQTRVEALVSCANTAFLLTSAGLELEGDSIAAGSPVEVLLHARDIDDLEVWYTRAAIELLWEDENVAEKERGLKVPFNTEVGTSEYTAMISAASTKEPGRYALSVRVATGAGARTGNGGSCEILRRSITVTADKTQLMIALVLIGVVLATIVLGGFLLYKNRKRAKKFFLSFLSFEGVLTADVAFEAWDVAGPFATLCGSASACLFLELLVVTLQATACSSSKFESRAANRGCRS
jgi:hypothetical protein